MKINREEVISRLEKTLDELKRVEHHTIEEEFWRLEKLLASIEKLLVF